MDLVGGYYDAGDNVKFGLPMAFTTTLLAWSVIEFGSSMHSQLEHAKSAIKWSTDYLLKAATATPDTLYVQVSKNSTPAKKYGKSTLIRVGSIDKSFGLVQLPLSVNNLLGPRPQAKAHALSDSCRGGVLHVCPKLVGAKPQIPYY